LFIQTALKFFDDPDPIAGSPWERGERLARLIRQHRTLLVLDGIEPLQYPVNDPQAGRLKDQALEALLQGLAADNPGLCIVTTREHLKNIENQATTEEQKLDKLVKDAAIALLRHLQITGTEAEMEAAWKDAGGHALTLQLLGRFLADAHGGDIRHYKEVKFEDADLERQGRSAFKVMIAYERWLQSAGPERQRELAVLRLTGLFDRPMSRDCLQALRAKPIIPGLTGALVGLQDPQWNIALNRLSDFDLLSVTSEAIDAHPLIREYFAKRLKETRPSAFKEAHSRLYDHLCKKTPFQPDTLDGLQPLYQAVLHGCLAGRQQEACDNVYYARLERGNEHYSSSTFGAVGADLSAVAAFFDEPWSQISSNLRKADQAWLLHEAAFCLRSVGRLNLALQPMRVGLSMRIQQRNWRQASIGAGSLSELEVTLGRLTNAVADANQSIAHADQSGDLDQRLLNRTIAADAMHQSGQHYEAGTLFSEAERLQREDEPQYPMLYSLSGFWYCDWLLAPAEIATWRALLQSAGVPHSVHADEQDSHVETCNELNCRAQVTLEWMIKGRGPLLTIAIEHLTLARVGLVREMLVSWLPQSTLHLPHVTAAVNGLRAAGAVEFLARGLLTAALYHFVRGDHASARTALDEAQQIAERGPMPLYLADVHLHRARLFRDKAELAKAAKLIRELGYGRRYEELEDAEAAARQWTTA
ncbi:MAG TPA: hypothetical protein VHR66_17325, partial [Gemmataceae bacterium]|nr:hypothetical protein [Gemmataceae bacterium]